MSPSSAVLWQFRLFETEAVGCIPSSPCTGWCWSRPALCPPAGEATRSLWDRGVRRKVRVGKSECSTATFIDAPYGAVFELAEDGKTLRRAARCARRQHPLPPFHGPLLVPTPFPFSKRLRSRVVECYVAGHGSWAGEEGGDLPGAGTAPRLGRKREALTAITRASTTPPPIRR